MKKIKGILLFGILTLLGIGSSFARDYNFYSVEYFDNSNRFSNFIFNAAGYGSITLDSANAGLITGLDSVWYWNKTGSITNSFLDLSNYTLSTFSSNWNNKVNNMTSNLYVDGSNISLLFHSNVSYYFNYLLNISNSVSDTNKLFLQNSGVFIRVNTNQGDGILIENPFNQSISPAGFRSWIFFPTKVYDSNVGFINDTQIAGTTYTRGSIVPGVGNEYSFSIVPEFTHSTGNNTFTIDLESVPYFFTTISPSIDGDYYSFTGVYILKLDSLFRKTNTGDFRILALSLSGSNFIYSRYLCPSNSISFVDCSYIDGGYLGSSDLSNSFSNLTVPGTISSVQQYNPTSAFSNLFFFLIAPIHRTINPIFHLSPNIYSTESTNIITLYRAYIYRSSSQGSYQGYNFNKSFGLIPQDGINVLEQFQNNGGYVQPTYSGSVSLGSDCVDTQICWDYTGSQGDIIKMCTTECVSPEVIESGSYVGSDGTIYYVGSNYNVGNISNSDGVIFDTGFLDEDGLLTIDYYSGLFNGNGFRFGVCPYPPSSYLNFATKIKLGNFYPFMPLNCFISAFQQGVKVHYFDDSGLFPDNHSQLMAGDTHYHKTLFRFFDVLLSIGILLLLSALLRIIKK